MESYSFDAAQVNQVVVTEANAGQRLDNFLLSLLKGVPKSHVYRIVRSGEVRRNGGRAKVDDRIALGDRIRIPPIRVAQPAANPDDGAARHEARKLAILFEDDDILVVDKPAGMAVHGGSGISFGVIEALRAARGPQTFLELAHRLDRDTSGVLLLAKRRPALVRLHASFRGDGDEGSGLDVRTMEKHYVAGVAGVPRWEKRRVDAPLRKYVTRAGERRVAVVERGEPGAMESTTLFQRQAIWRSDDVAFACVDAQLLTGRTHQIRMHLKHVGHPILGDDKYGDETSARITAAMGLKRMFLHAARLVLPHPTLGHRLELRSALPRDLAAWLAKASSDAPCGEADS